MIAPGAIVGDGYRLDAEIGRGAMGSVWSATHTSSGERVAVKLLRRPERDDLVRRFFQEARAASAVSHPCLVAVHDVFVLDDGTPAMTMDLLAGETLSAHLARSPPLDAAAAAALFLPLVSGVGALHGAGIVHRDLKPDNVFLVEGATGASRVRVLDLGIAKLFGTDGGATETGATLGTPAYMAPEQAMGARDVDLRADVWALGAMLYEALSGARPVDGENQGQVVRALLTVGIAPLEVVAPDVPIELAHVVDAMLAKERDERPGDLRSVAAALAPYVPDLHVPPIEPPARGVAPPSPRAEGPAPDVGPGAAPPRAPGPRAAPQSWLPAALGLLLVALVALVAWGGLRARRTSATPPRAPEPSAITPAPPLSDPSPSFPIAPPAMSASSTASVAAPARSPPKLVSRSGASAPAVDPVSVPAAAPPPRAPRAPGSGLIEVPPFLATDDVPQVAAARRSLASRDTAHGRRFIVPPLARNALPVQLS